MGYLRKQIYSYQQDIQNCKKQLSFEEIYLNILKEDVALNGFTPEPLLNDIVNKCFWLKNLIGMYQIYPLEKIIRLSGNQLKNKQKFLYALNHVNKNSDFAINVIYLKQISENAINQIKNQYPYQFFNQYTNFEYNNKMLNAVQYCLDTISKNINLYKNSKGNNFNNIEKQPSAGCCIFINGELVKTHRQFEQIFDHELNHYFTKMGFFEGYDNINYQLPKLKENSKVNQLLNKYYKFNNNKNYEYNIKLHLYNDKEFYSMCSTVFHTLLKEIQKFNNKLTRESFLNMINYDFINQSDFLNDKILNHDLREAVMFCYVNKELAPDRFQIILKGINTAFSIKKKHISKILYKNQRFNS